MDAVRVNLVSEFNLDDNSAEDLQIKQTATTSSLNGGLFSNNGVNMLNSAIANTSILSFSTGSSSSGSSQKIGNNLSSFRMAR